MSKNIWAEIDAILQESVHPMQQEGEVSVADLIERYGWSRSVARDRFDKLLINGWQKKWVIRRATGKPCIVAYKPPE